MPTGFKGTRVEISEITVTGSAVRFGVKFIGDDELTHAVTNHEIPHDETKDIQAALRRLLGALKSWTETTHFDGGPTNVPQKATVNGIAEAISASNRDEGLSGVGGTKQDGS